MLLVLGLAGFATLKGITAVLRVATVDAVALALAGGQDLPSLLVAATGMARPTLALLLGLLVGGALLAVRSGAARGPPRQACSAASALGVLVVAAWWVSGRLGHVAEHPQTLRGGVSRHQLAAHGVAELRLADRLHDRLAAVLQRREQGADDRHRHGGRRDRRRALHVAWPRSFRWEGFGGAEDTANHFVGGVLMGVGGVTALGCTIGQGLSGLSTLALGSLIALAAILGGGFAGVRYQAWRIERAG